MLTREDLESIIYREKLAHQAWMNKAFLQGIQLPEDVSELVWEMLIAYAEYVDDLDNISQDIYKTAYELAMKLLPSVPIDQILKYYRDYLMDAMIDYAKGQERDQSRQLVKFSNLLSSAYCEAHSDLLKKTIRHNRAENVSRELKVAKQIQSHLLPKVIPKIEGFDFAGRLIPATEIGGDYWSIKYHEKDNIITLKLADITGHGIAAATLVAAVKFISGGYYHGSESAVEVMNKTNRVLAIETPHEILVTMVYAWLDPATYEVTIVNAGHAPVFLCQKGLCIDVPPTGTPLGFAEDTQYGEQRFKLSKGDLIFFGSDGITEAGVGQQFGTERLKELVLSNTHLSADEIANKVVQSVRDFAKQPHDDISLLVTRVTGEPAAP
ncbi:MAG: PP2C family protein-serine/threonine phosphatase [Armatimonadota bacterium]|nr:serine/threonine-protein phosphatase [bacterium]